MPDIRERLTVENGRWTLRWRGMPGIRAGLSGRDVWTPSRGPSRDETPTAHVKQVHGCDVVRVQEEGFAGQADGLMTACHDLRLVIQVADCVPVLLAAPWGVAAIHAGWRGAAGGIVSRALGQFLLESGGTAAEVAAWVGPAIGTCCFEVGPEVAASFPQAVARRQRGRHHIDLAGAIAGGLIEKGLPETAVDVSRYCTRCHQHLWHSHRGSGGRPDRLVAWISRLGQDDSSVAR